MTSQVLVLVIGITIVWKNSLKAYFGKEIGLDQIISVSQRESVVVRQWHPSTVSNWMWEDQRNGAWLLGPLGLCQLIGRIWMTRVQTTTNEGKP